MGFLSGVLGAVKDENEVQNYNKDMQLKIETVITTLTNKIGTGREGLVESVEKVKGWLEGYEGEITKKRKAVTDKLGDLKDEKIDDYAKLINSNNALPEQLTVWDWVLGNITTDLQNIENENVNKFDKSLKEKVQNKIEPIKKSVELLKNSAKQDKFVKQAAKVESELVQQKKKIQQELHLRFMNIHNGIESLKDERKKGIRGIKDHLNDAMKLVDKELGNDADSLRNAILAIFDKIKWELRYLNTDNDAPFGGDEHNSRLKRDVDAIKTMLLTVGDELNGQLLQLSTKIEEAEDMRVKALSKARTVHTALNPSGNGTDTIGQQAINIDNAKRLIDNARIKLETQADHLAKWKEEAVKVVQKGIGRCDEILKRVSAKAHKEAIIFKEGTDIEDKATKLLMAYSEASQGLQELVKIATQQVTEFDIHLRSGLYRAKEAIENGIGAYVDNVVDAVKAGIAASEGNFDGNKAFNALKGAVGETNGLGILLGLAGANRSQFPGRLDLVLDALKNKPVENEEAIKKIKSELTAKLNEQLPNEGPGVGTPVVEKRVKLEGNNFSRYDINKSNVVQQFTTVGKGILKPFETSKNSTKAVKSPGDPQEDIKEVREKFEAIERQLKALTALLTDDGESMFGGKDMNRKGLKTLLTELDCSFKLEVLGDAKHGFQATTNAIRDIHTSALPTPIASITDSVSSITKQLEQLQRELEYSGGSSLSDKGIIDHLQALNEKLGQNKQTDESLKAACDRLKQLYNTEMNNAGRIQNAISTVTTLIGELENVERNIDEKRESVERKIQQLKDKVDGHLSAIEMKITEADRILSAAIVVLENALQEARQNAEQAITSAFATVTNQVRTLFSDAHKADLAALKTLVEGQKAEIERIIGDDKRNGVKGLLTKLYGGEFPKLPDVRTPDDNKLEGMKRLVDPPTPSLSAKEYLTKFKHLADQFRNYSDPILMYIQGQVMTPGSPKQPTDQSTKVADLKNAVDFLLKYIAHNDTICHFDDYFVKLVDNLNSQLTSLHPSSFADSPSPLLAPLKAGLSAFAAQLGHAYVSRYSGMKMGELTKREAAKSSESTPTKPDTSPKEITVLTTEGRNCAKVCLTIVEILGHDLSQLRKATEKSGWKTKEMCLYDGNDVNRNENALGFWFMSCGFKVPDDKKNQNGELKYEEEWTGEKIHDLIVKADKSVFTHDDARKDFRGPLRKIHNHLDTYYRVSHLNHIEKPKTPSTIYQMLQWLLGLEYNPMFIKIKDQFNKLLISLQEEYKLSEPKLDAAVPEFTNSIIKSRLDSKQLTDALFHVCFQSERALVAILGHGQEDGRYGCEFYTNAEELKYPSSAGACFDMLVDILNRVYHQLGFLLKQCQSDSRSAGWSDCHYGKGIGGSSWKCNALQCTNQKCNQNNNQMGDQHPSCGLKSPLQSYLEDGLQGFLPHSFKKPGCNLDCTVSNHRGLPCKTPLGFSDISNMASHVKTGAYLSTVLEDVCGAHSYLGQLCGMLNCLLRRPPQTLGDMFAFYYNFIYGWDGSGSKHRKEAFERAVKEANFGNTDTECDISSLFSTSHIPEHKKRDLFSLVCPGDTGTMNICGRYVQPLGINLWTVFCENHADKYLSWIVYLTETFYQLLQKLYEECCDNCKRTGGRWHGKICVQTCNVKSYYECLSSASQSTKSRQSPSAATNPTHEELCKSIAHCPSTRPTLSRYGIVLKSYSNLSGTNGKQTKRTCDDFCNALKNVLSDAKSDAAPLAKLVFDTIPEFLFKIRAPFIWLNVALWLLSLLYLLHIMVIRLDLLHIKSHLHSPSSHRIAAQSLLAAARVNKLNRVFYLQP